MPDSIFTKIINREIPADVVFEDERYIAVRDVDPQAPTHLLVVPKRPIPTLNDLTPADAELVGGLFLTAARVMADAGILDYRAVINCGAAAGQSVFHLHLHVLAGRPFEWPPG